MAKLDYMEEGLFPPLPTPVQERYDAWRVQEKKKLFPNIEDDLQRWLKMYNPLGGANMDEIEARVIKEGANYRVTLPKAIGEKLYRKNITMRIPKEEEPLELEQPAEEESTG
jgi:hypothetical protein